MSNSDRLLLILHIGFAIFTLGPLTAATMASPRQIRRRNVVVLHYLIRATRIYGLAALGIFLFGLLLAGGEFSQVWLSASMTLFIVALVLLLIVGRDQQRAAHKLELAAKTVGAGAGTGLSVAEPDDKVGDEGVDQEKAAQDTETGAAAEAGTSTTATPADGEIAQVERGRIAALSGVIAAIWLVILFLMVWYA